jgi:hypothetical protein
MINVVCVLRNGGKVGYDATWVEKLKNSVARNLTLEHRFICLSDVNVPCEHIPLISHNAGFWAKLELFRPSLFDCPELYIDLDTVICANLDDLVDRIKDQQFVMLLETDKNVVSSAVMWWQGDHSYLWDQYLEISSKEIKEKYSKMPRYGDQAFIEDYTDHTLLQDYIPTEWVGFSSQREISTDTKILIFRKVSQKPSTMLDHPLVQQHWY